MKNNIFILFWAFIISSQALSAGFAPGSRPLICDKVDLVPAQGMILSMCLKRVNGEKTLTVSLQGPKNQQKTVEIMHSLSATVNGEKVPLKEVVNAVDGANFDLSNFNRIKDFQINLGEIPLTSKLKLSQKKQSFVRPKIKRREPIFSVSEIRELYDPSKSVESTIKTPSFKAKKVGHYGNTTDLHTHYPGALGGDDLLKSAEEVDLTLPREYFKKNNISVPEEVLNRIKTPDGNIPVRKLGEYRWELARKLSIPADHIGDFGEMESIYNLRRPFTKIEGDTSLRSKQIEMVRRQLWKLAADYQRNGIKYAELSVSDVINPSDSAFYDTVAKVLPELEKKTGVKIRFLAAIWRGSNTKDAKELASQKAYIKKSVDDLIRLGPSRPYIVGMDIMGEEVNPTEFFSDDIKRVSNFFRTPGQSAKEGFQIRIHSGENSIFKNNVKTAIEAGATRIGHGLYGIDAETLKLAKERGTIIEINSSSNVALSNAEYDNIKTAINKWKSNGVDIVLGTDGHGLYGTLPGSSEASYVHKMGLSDSDLNSMRKYESGYIGVQENAEIHRMRRIKKIDLLVSDLIKDLPCLP